jgi:capsular exopolysaccharide synthesis family protein
MPSGVGRPREASPDWKENTLASGTTIELAVDFRRLREKRIVAVDDVDPAAGAYKVLRTHVLQRMRVKGWKTLAITSASEGNGKTVTAINLAISLAREVNQTTLLADLDLRRPSIAPYFVDHEIPGLSEYLTGEKEIADILIKPGFERLVILPGHHSFTHSSELLSSPRMMRLVEELKGRYPDRLVLFDMPPVLTGDDVIAFLPYVDAVILVIEEGVTTKNDLQRAYELLGEDKLLGTVLNKSDEASAGEYY